MFFWKRNIVKCRKVTFGITSEYLVLYSALIPDIQNNVVSFKVKNIAVFKYIVWELIKLVCIEKDVFFWVFMSIRVRRPLFLSDYRKLLFEISKDTNFANIWNKFNEMKNEKPKKKENIKDKYGNVVNREDYLSSYISVSYKSILPYCDWTEKEFNENVGFLEYEEVISELAKKKIERIMEDINVFKLVICAALTKDGVDELTDYLTSLRNERAKLDDVGFDRVAFRDAIMGVKKNGG